MDFANESRLIEFLDTFDKPYTPNEGPAFEADLKHLISLYPDSPAFGSPFDTGNNTFGIDPGFKRAAAIVGDFAFQALRRAWIQALTSFGVDGYGYLFTYPNAANPAEPQLGGKSLHCAKDFDGDGTVYSCTYV